MLLDTKEEEDAEEDDEENYSVDDYDYGDYESATINSDIDLIAGGSLPIFLAEPVDTFVVKGKPATLHCRAAHALQVCKINPFSVTIIQRRNISLLTENLHMASYFIVSIVKKDFFFMELTSPLSNRV